MLQKAQLSMTKVWLQLDWMLFFSILPIIAVGLITMNAFVGDNYLFNKQLISIAVAVIIFFILSFVDFRFLRRTPVIVTLFLVSCGILLILFA